MTRASSQLTNTVKVTCSEAAQISPLRADLKNGDRRIFCCDSKERMMQVIYRQYTGKKVASDTNRPRMSCLADCQFYATCDGRPWRLGDTHQPVTAN